MGQLKYKLNGTISNEWLQENRFLYSRGFSDIDDPVYSRRFPVHRWGDAITLEAEIRLHSKTGEATVDVYDGCSSFRRSVFAPFYRPIEPAYEEFIGIILKNIEKECDRLGLEQQWKE